MDEVALIHAAQRGDLPAFNQLILHYQGLAYNVAFRVLGEPDMAADATQDGFLKAYRALASFRGGSFKSWLLRIITNTCYDQLRSQKRRPATSLEDLAVELDHVPDLIQHDPDPEEIVLRGELGAMIQSGIQGLPEDQRTTLVLADIEGLSYQEIAEVTGVQLGTVKSRLSRARLRLRGFLLDRPELLPQQYRLRAGDERSATYDE
jgi:RNA polymerase sigma-70 factor (ECF subfamily)